MRPRPTSPLRAGNCVRDVREAIRSGLGLPKV